MNNTLEYIDCVICMNATNTICGRRARAISPRNSGDKTLKCKHTFHQACIDKWFSTNLRDNPFQQQTCPCCRHPVRRHAHPSNSFTYFEVINIEELEDDELSEKESYYEEILDKYIYHDFHHIILFVNHLKQLFLHHYNACMCGSSLAYKDTPHTQRKYI